MLRRSFLRKAVWSATALTATPLVAFGSNPLSYVRKKELKDLKLSLSQWSLHRHFFDGKLVPDDFASIAIYT